MTQSTITKNRLFLFCNGSLYGSGNSEQISEMIEDYVCTSEMFNSEEVNFEILNEKLAKKRLSWEFFKQENPEGASGAALLDLTDEFEKLINQDTLPDDAYSIARNRLIQILELE